MKIFKAFDTTEVTKFATSLAEDLSRRFPPASERRTDAGAVNQLKVVLTGLGARAATFKQEKGLGLYQKAKLGNVFRWKLEEFGYSKEFIDRVTKDLVTRMTVN